MLSEWKYNYSEVQFCATQKAIILHNPLSHSSFQQLSFSNTKNQLNCSKVFGFLL